jgi:hypothetical protein
MSNDQELNSYQEDSDDYSIDDELGHVKSKTAQDIEQEREQPLISEDSSRIVKRSEDFNGTQPIAVIKKKSNRNAS